MQENTFDLKPIIIAGVEMNTRPIDFEYDKDGVATKATKYITTCPKCSTCLEINADTLLYKDEKTYYSGCAECPVPVDVAPPVNTSKEFVDPIATGKMIIEAEKIDG